MKTALSQKIKHETRLKATDMILDRIHGKPKQDIEQTITTFDVAEDDIMKKIKERIR
jgi:hypothetical protein